VLVYVDSGSVDGSVAIARKRGAEIVELDLSIPFTAARARNVGFARARAICGSLRYIQFVDGDCELDPDWTLSATRFLESRPGVAAVFGRLRERNPEKSIYNWLCDQEWNGPIGEVRSFAGNVMIRCEALSSVGGYRDDVIAAEEDELCVRLRAENWTIYRISDDMALHDAEMTHFIQWWKRSLRCGYAFAQGAHLHGRKSERHFVWESRRARLWGIFLPLLCIYTGLLFYPIGWASFLIYPLQVLRLVRRSSGPLSDRLLIAGFQVLGRFPEGLGQLKFVLDKVFRRRAELIEHK
jgi:glycosyltransferase involved in cell wall biosynthesis